MKALCPVLLGLFILAGATAAQTKDKKKVTPVKKQDPKDKSKAKTVAAAVAGFSLFNSTAKGHNLTNAYLLALISECIYPQTLKIKSKDQKVFAEAFKKAVSPGASRASLTSTTRAATPRPRSCPPTRSSSWSSAAPRPTTSIRLSRTG